MSGSLAKARRTSAILAASLLLAVPAVAFADQDEAAKVDLPRVDLPDVPGVDEPSLESPPVVGDLPGGGGGGGGGDPVGDTVGELVPGGDSGPGPGGPASAANDSGAGVGTSGTDPVGGGGPGGAAGGPAGALVPGGGGGDAGGAAGGDAGGAAGGDGDGGPSTDPLASSRARDKAASSTPSRSGAIGDRFRDALKAIPQSVKLIMALLALIAVAFLVRSLFSDRRARRLERQRQELLSDVGLLQTALLPDVPEWMEGMRASVAYRPAEGPAAGGDFYDVFKLSEGRVAVILGDVSGHGRQALARTASVRFTLRAYLEAGLDPRATLQVAGRTLETDLGGFTTVVVAICDTRRGTLTYSAAGHEQPIVVGPATFEPVTPYSSPPVGVGPTGFRQTTIFVPRGSVVCFFTDGLSEARMKGGEQLGRARLEAIVGEVSRDGGARSVLQRVASDADKAVDDMAACLVEFEGDAVEVQRNERTVRIEELEVDSQLLQGDGLEEFLVACGVPGAERREVTASATTTAGEFGSAILWVHIADTGVSVEVMRGDEDQAEPALSDHPPERPAAAAELSRQTPY